jgi:hypothetical protein
MRFSAAIGSLRRGAHHAEKKLQDAKPAITGFELAHIAA